MKAFLNSDKIKTKWPEWFQRLTDTLFKGMPNADAKEFPLLFLKSIPIGFDNWEHIYHQLCLHDLEKECKNIDHPLVKQAACDIITLCHRTEETDQIKWSAAELAAKSAGSAAESAAKSVGFATWSPRSAAWSVESIDWSVTYKSIADKLRELLKENKK